MNTTIPWLLLSFFFLEHKTPFNYEQTRMLYKLQKQLKEMFKNLKIKTIMSGTQEHIQH